MEKVYAVMSLFITNDKNVLNSNFSAFSFYQKGMNENLPFLLNDLKSSVFKDVEDTKELFPNINGEFKDSLSLNYVDKSNYEDFTDFIKNYFLENNQETELAMTVAFDVDMLLKIINEYNFNVSLPTDIEESKCFLLSQYGVSSDELLSFIKFNNEYICLLNTVDYKNKYHVELDSCFYDDEDGSSKNSSNLHENILQFINDMSKLLDGDFFENKIKLMQSLYKNIDDVLICWLKYENYNDDIDYDMFEKNQPELVKVYLNLFGIENVMKVLNDNSVKANTLSKELVLLLSQYSEKECVRSFFPYYFTDERVYSVDNGKVVLDMNKISHKSLGSCKDRNIRALVEIIEKRAKDFNIDLTLDGFETLHFHNLNEERIYNLMDKSIDLLNFKNFNAYKLSYFDVEEKVGYIMHEIKLHDKLVNTGLEKKETVKVKNKL